MVKQLMDLCLGCIAQNLNTISNVGKHLPTRHKEKLLQWVVDHNMLTADYLPHVTYHLFSPALRSLSFRECDQISDKILAQLDACQCRLERIEIEGCKVTDVGISSLLSHQVQLQSLTLKNIPDMTGTGLEVLRSTNLEEVDLSQCINLQNKSVAALVNKNPNITSLNLRSCYKLTSEIVDAVAKTLSSKLENLDLSSLHTLENNNLVVLSQHCKNLKGLVLHGCNRITSAGLMHVFKECTTLQNLDVSFCYKLQETASCTDFLTSLPPSLKILVLSGLQLEGKDLCAALERLPMLHTLRLCGINSIKEDETIEMLQQFGGQLVCLDMTGCHHIMTDYLLKAIVKHCTVLEEVLLAFCMKLTGEPLRDLFRDQARARYLTRISVSGCKEISHDVLLEMSQVCTGMKELNLAGIMSVDDTLLFSIAHHMPLLHHISLKSCVGAHDQVTDNGVVELARCCLLEDISLAGIQKITDKSVFALANNCPDLKTLFISGCKMITAQATNYLQDVCNSKVHVYHRVPNADPNLVMAKNLDTGEFCRVDQTAWSKW